MNLTSKKIIKDLLKKHGIWAKKSLGQHFLIDKNILEKIIKTANLTKDDTVLEIGPGIGVLTKELSLKAKKVIAVEIDKRMTEILKETLHDRNNVEIIVGDILKFEDLKIKNFRIIANIPYQITSAILEKFLTNPNKPEEIILMVQKEVAQKICAKPPDMNRLAILVQSYGKPEITAYVSKNSFWPPPEVDSAILKISEIKIKRVKQDKLFFDLVKKGFSQKRKQLKNIFDNEILKNAGISPTKRAEELEIKDWQALTDKFS